MYGFHWLSPARLLVHAQTWASVHNQKVYLPRRRGLEKAAGFR